MLANCVVGLGFSYRGFRAGLERKPHLIGCDAGSADFGPGFLGSGRDAKSALAVRRDLKLMMEGAHEAGCPLVLGSCGGAGSRPHVLGYERMVRQIAAELRISPRIALIHADQDKDTLHSALTRSRIRPLGPFPQLTHADIDSSSDIVAMMGAGPVAAALEAGADIVLAGRCADPAIYAAQAMRLGADPALAWHAAKCVDKGYLATTAPSEGSPVLATIRGDHFDIEPTKTGAVCTVASVARTAMYENPDPFTLRQPTGELDVSRARYEQIGNAVRVRCSRFTDTAPTVKLEGARLTGHRAILLVGLRDPRLLARLDEFLDRYRTLLDAAARSMGVEPERYTVVFRPYGRDAVLGPAEPSAGVPVEVGLVVDVVADTPDLALALAGRAGPIGSRLDVGGGMGSGGNFAYPFSPSSIALGPVYEWSVWHVMDVDDEKDPFRVELAAA